MVLLEPMLHRVEHCENVTLVTCMQFWRGDMTCLQKLVSSVFHSVRGFLDADALRELGTSITSCALRHFYGVKPPTPTTISKRVAARMGR